MRRSKQRRPSTPTAGCTPATSARWTTTATYSIVGRIKDMVIRGGENIYPRDRRFLYRHPSIADVQIVGVPDETYGEGLVAWVHLNPGTSLTIEVLRPSVTDSSPTTRSRATSM